MTTIIHPPLEIGPADDDGAQPIIPEAQIPVPVEEPDPGSSEGDEERRTQRPGAPGVIGTRQPKKPLGPTAVLVGASVVMLGGLLSWVAFANFTATSGSARSWEKVPMSQPYYVAPAEPKIPTTGVSASGGMAGMSMGQKPSTGTATASAASATKLPPMFDSTPTATVTLKVDPPPLGGMYGSDGQVHDNFSPAYFAVPAGKTVHVTVYNYDDMWHTFTSPVLGVNVWINPGGDHPSKTTFSFTAPKTGYYWWLCDIPCDSYSMNSGGYMQGEIHAVKA